MIRARLSVALSVVAVFLGACGAPDSGLLPPPSSTSSTSTVPVTQPVDRTAIRLEAFPGVTTTTIPIEVGRSTLRGTVLGPEGAVPGAVVRIERLVGDAVQSRDVAADPAGTFVVANVPGGRYRMRAFLAPRLAMVQPEIFYMEDGSERTVDLRTEVYEGVAVMASATPGTPIVGQGVNIAVRVANRTVEPDGIGREVPVAGVGVRLRTSGLTSLDAEPTPPPDDPDDDPDDDPGGDDPAGDDEPDDDTTSSGADSSPPSRVTDANGVIVFQFRCDQVGATTATAVVTVGEDEETFPLDIPPCSPVPTTTTTAPPEGTEPDASTTTEP